MPISIQDSQTELLARKLADLTGETLTEAIRMAVTERYERLRQARFGCVPPGERPHRDRNALRQPSDQIRSQLPMKFGYDESGVPTR